MKIIGLSIVFLAILPITAQVKGTLSPDVIYARSKDSVVTIITFDSEHKPFGQGSGFITSKNRVVTNYHVLAGSSAASVLFDDGTVTPVKFVIAASAPKDIAVLEVDTGVRTPLTIGNELILKIGETVYAIGAPSGLSGSLSSGLVSAFRQDEGEFLIQITAAIAPGSSGGPLLNSRGEVVGMTTSHLKDGGFGFALGAGDIQHLLKVPLAVKLQVSDLSAEDASDSSQPLQPTEELVNDKKYSDALAKFNSLPSPIKSGFEGNVLLCEIEEGLSEYQRAFKACDAAISQRPNDAKPYGVKAFTLIKAGDLEGAETAATKAVQLSDSDYYKKILGFVYYQSEKYDRVPAFLSRASTEPIEISMLVGAGFHANNNELFQSAYAKLASLTNNDNGWIFYFNGRDAEKNLDFSTAATDFRKCDADENFIDSLCILALAHVETRSGDYPSAKADTEAALRRYPKNHVILSHAIFLELLLANNSEAQRLHAVLKATPQSPYDDASDCLYYYGVGQANIATGYCSRVAQAYPDSYSAWSNAGWAALDIADFRTALFDFGKAERLFYASTDKHTVTQELDVGWGLILATYYSGDKKDAKTLYRAMKKTYPDFMTMPSLKQLPLVWSANTQALIHRVTSDLK